MEAMDISSIVTSLFSQSYTSQQQTPSSTSGAVTAAFNKASSRVAQQLIGTRVCNFASRAAVLILTD